MLPYDKGLPRISKPRSRRTFLTTAVGGFFGGALFGFSLPRLALLPSPQAGNLAPEDLEDLVQRLGKLPPRDLALFGPDLVQLSFSLPGSKGLERSLETLVLHLGDLPPQQGKDLASLLVPGLDRIGRKDLQAKALLFQASPSNPKEN